MAEEALRRFNEEDDSVVAVEEVEWELGGWAREFVAAEVEFENVELKWEDDVLSEFGTTAESEVTEGDGEIVGETAGESKTRTLGFGIRELDMIAPCELFAL